MGPRAPDPTTLIALLKAVAYGWRQMSLAQNAETIRTLGEDLYRRLAVFSGHLSRLGRSLTTTVDSFNSAVGSLERQVLPGARKFTELGVRPDRDLETLEPIDRLAREPQVTSAQQDIENVLSPEAAGKSPMPEQASSSPSNSSRVDTAR